MFFVVLGILQADSNVLLMAVFLAVGAAFLAAFFLYIRSRERAGKEALLSTGLFKNRTSNLGLVTQNAQWFILMGTSFVVAVYLQTVRGYNAIETGVIFTAATLGILVSSLGAERFARKRTQRTLIVGGFVVTLAGIGLLLGLVPSWSSVVAFVPGLLLIGLGLGVMLTPSVNVVQSSFPEELQGEISGLSRSVSNLGSSFGTAICRHDPGVRPGHRRVRLDDGRPCGSCGHRTRGGAVLSCPARAAGACRRSAPVTTAEIGPRGLCEHRDARVLSRWLGSSPGWTKSTLQEGFFCGLRTAPGTAPGGLIRSRLAQQRGVVELGFVDQDMRVVFEPEVANARFVNPRVSRTLEDVAISSVDEAVVNCWERAGDARTERRHQDSGERGDREPHHGAFPTPHRSFSRVEKPLMT
jgi:hypothetical protein